MIVFSGVEFVVVLRCEEVVVADGHFVSVFGGELVGDGFETVHFFVGWHWIVFSLMKFVLEACQTLFGHY